MTKKPTSIKVEMAGGEYDVNNLDGEMTYYPLHDENSNFYADAENVNDCKVAKLDGSEGDWMMLEPFYWYKGINDYLNGKHYTCKSSYAKDDMPPCPEATVLSLEDIKGELGGYISGKKITIGKPSIKDSYATDSNYSVCMVNVEGRKRVRFPSVPGTGMVGASFSDGEGNVVKSVMVDMIALKFEAGMYIISDIPENAVSLYFSILNTAEFDCVVLSDSMKIEDMEPEWAFMDEHLCAVTESSIVGSSLRSCATGKAGASNMPWSDFHYYSFKRGMQQIDPMMHSNIANLFYERYGRRDAQVQCGPGQHTSERAMGETASYGIRDTIGYDEAKKIDPKLSPTQLIDGAVREYSWYRELDEYDTPIVKRVSSNCIVGYVNACGNLAEWMDRVDLPNDSQNLFKWRIFMPDGSQRKVKGSNTNGIWITGVAHGRYADVIPVGILIGSSTSYYTDMYWVNGAASRVVYRSVSSAYARGGVAYANASYDASYALADIGSRLAFRGKIVRAQSVAAFKAINEVA